MGAIQVMITKPAQLSVRDCQLVIQEETEKSVPIEDVSCLLIDDQRTTITTALLTELSEKGVAVFYCNGKHLPCVMSTPIFVHSQGFGRMRLQLEASEPAKKRIWQSIVIQKIRNQSFCLEHYGMKEEAKTLLTLAQYVKSGDSENLEAIAARTYFKALFGADFTRGQDSWINAALNYGYAILRGGLARSLTAGGFYPSLGLFHHSKGNNFNLADDLIEPFRPLVDLFVYPGVDRSGDLSFDDRKKLFNVLNAEVLLNEHRVSVDYAIRSSVWALEGAFVKKPHMMPKLCLTERSTREHGGIE